ncbi:hypothetical protein ABD76_05340 [Paenibacillus dendritiformis]|uniref:DUF2614 family zinc ribbon-containing protein n=1 Tax=Paenibacillus dendritiformis TaxID=130049 RepID=UPI0018CE4223|nr:DUF2614 family zinc ribbon-containing protein [Paenibacillus dendritiformis]MBG9791940.1 hypothetical protein [Paenibacillus dendritiformis]
MNTRLFKTSKLSEFRLWGLVLILAGMGMMILGTSGILMWGVQGRPFAAVFMVLGGILLLGSMGIYFWAGMLSTSVVALECPECGKPTKMIGKTDRCMFCRTILTFDPAKATAGLSEEAPSESGQPAASAPKS